MITADNKKILVFGKDYKPIEVYKNGKKIGGSNEVGFSGNEAEFLNTYSDYLKIYGKTAYDNNETPPSPDNIKNFISSSGTIYISDTDGNETAYTVPELRGIVARKQGYNYSENSNGILKNYVCDYVYKDKIVRNIGVYVFDGSELFHIYRNDESTIAFRTLKEPLPKKWYDSASTCNMFTYNSGALADEEGYSAGDYSGNLNFRLNHSRNIDTLEKFKNYLADLYNSGTPLCVLCQLNEPVTETLSSPVLKTYPKYTKIKVENTFAEVPLATSKCIKIYK